MTYFRYLMLAATVAATVGPTPNAQVAERIDNPEQLSPSTAANADRSASSLTLTSTKTWAPRPGSPFPPVVFVSRQIPPNGSVYWDAPNDMPGVGPYSRFRVAAPAKLMVLAADRKARILIDGAHPSPASLNLIDVNAPDVSYDGQRIVFAGFSLDHYDPVEHTKPLRNPGNWRLYVINADGKGLRQITFTDQNLDYSQFADGAGALRTYDDTDSTWLPDGRIVFSSTRWPSFAQYSGVRTTNLYVVNADGSELHRITSERNGADRPMVDPMTGKIVYARWWRNHRFAINSMETVMDPHGGYVRKDGLSADRGSQVGGADFLWRNHWHAATINPDGTGLKQWGGPNHILDASHMYGGAFAPNGDLIANYFPMSNMTEAAGFGGLRRYGRGPDIYQPILGVTYPTLRYIHLEDPTSYGIFEGPYASEPVVLPDGRLIISWAKDTYQDYGLYLAPADGSSLTLLYDNVGATELRAKLLCARPVPPVIPDSVPPGAELLPPTAVGPYDRDGTFVFDALNVYFNGRVDTVDTSAPPVGSADRIRFFLDTQRTSPGSFPNLDWPILLGERAVNPDGSVREPNAPANAPLFEQIRSKDNTVPLTPGNPGGAVHVAGMNFGRPGQIVRCVGCHAGHTLIEVPEKDEAAKWTNLAPGAQIRVSSTRDPNLNRGLVDRRVMKGEIWRYWNSAPDQTQNQWVELVFPVPVTVRTVRLYNPRFGDEANSTLQVNSATVRLYSDTMASRQVASGTTGPLAVTGTEVPFNDVRTRVIRVEIGGVSGTFYGIHLVSLAEVEVIARAEAGP